MRASRTLMMTLAAMAVIASAPGGLAREEIPAETRELPYSANLPGCDSPSVLSEIQSRFSRTERRYWQSSTEIRQIDRIRQAAFRPHGLDIIPRRYCQAVATMSDRRRLTLRYAIVEDTGLFGYGAGVQYCLDGYDRNNTAPPSCYRLDR
ncbi:MAG TPA: hypothetical protein PKW21_06540 [Rhabdaerophilum sp.]|nr:hypothetical protein [Rhabdaerophilum sp.]